MRENDIDGFKIKVRKVTISLILIALAALPSYGADKSQAEVEPVLRKIFPMKTGKAVKPAIVCIWDQRKCEGFVGCGGGSGIIISPDGYILTNWSVIKNNPDKIIVTLYQPRKEISDVEVIGMDKENDIAILKIDSPFHLSYASLNNSEHYVGQRVFALSWNVPYGPMVTPGTIIDTVNTENTFLPSGLLPNVEMIAFDTDTDLPPASMGGALINMKEGVIGVLYGRKEGVDKSVNLAISINSIKPILASIFESGKVTKGWIGKSKSNYVVGDGSPTRFNFKFSASLE